MFNSERLTHFIGENEASICEGDRGADSLGHFSPSLWIMPPYKQDLTHAKQQTESTVVYTIIIYFHILKCLIINEKIVLKLPRHVLQLTQFDSERCYVGL